MWQGPQLMDTFGIHHNSKQKSFQRQIYKEKVSHQFRHTKTEHCFCLITLTAVATTEPLGGLSLYLGVPATKIMIAMAGENTEGC